MGRRHASHEYPAPASSGAVVREVPAGTFNNTCLQLLDQVQQQEFEIVVTKHGKPVARLVPIESKGATGFGFMRGTVVSHGDLVSPDPEAWGEFG
ncbi:MAG: type II toxin-antitoxin system Phd/YefM family antitoxin [Gemmatimonas sp.]|uniref:type II toxin-antitoxin system Phd/YefM family antitoxin n=1 Tax=Gemmatimonas sp. TaxID=1962908 RepID=UPI00391F3DB0